LSDFGHGVGNFKARRREVEPRGVVVFNQSS
jgi:hypothetical protein